MYGNYGAFTQYCYTTSMSMGEALNRGFNLLAAAMVAVSSFTFLPSIFLSSEPFFEKSDDILLAFLGLATIWWYGRHTNRFKRSTLPIVFAALGTGLKVFGYIIRGGTILFPTDTFGGIVLFALITGVITWQYYKTQQLIDSFRV
jgi:hypothetical protein